VEYSMGFSASTNTVQKSKTNPSKSAPAFDLRV